MAHEPFWSDSDSMLVDGVSASGTRSLSPHGPMPVLHRVLDHLDIGVIVCDAHSRLLLANLRAREELTHSRLLQIDPHGSLSAMGRGDQILRRAVRGAVTSGRHELVILRHLADMQMVSVQPLQVMEGGPAGALVLLGRRAGLELSVQELARICGLTVAELEVLRGLVAGNRPSELARQRAVSLSTVRTQISTLRRKLGVRRVQDISRMVGELPPMVGALRSGSGLPAASHPPRLGNGMSA